MAIDDADGRLLDRPATELLGNCLTGHVLVSPAMASSEKDPPHLISYTEDLNALDHR